MADDGFTAFFQSAYPRVVGQLRLLTGDQASAEDVAQEAFIRAATRWRQLAHYDQPEAWVRTTAFRLAIDLLRRTRRHRRALARAGTRRVAAELDPRTVPSSRRCCGCATAAGGPGPTCLDLPVDNNPVA